MEQSSFSTGNTGSVQNKPTADDSAPKDEYKGGYREGTATEAEKFGTDQNPVQNDALPARNLRGAGG